MPRKPKKGRPQPFDVTTADHRARVRCLGFKQGETYRWRAESHKDRVTVWSGRGTKAEAQAATHAALLAGKAVPRPKVEGNRVGDVTDLLRAWLAWLSKHRTNRTESTVKAHRLSARHVRELVGSVPIHAVDSSTATRLRAMLLDKYAPRTAKTDLGRFLWAMRLGGELGWIERRELAVEPILVPEAEKRTPTMSEVRRVLGKVQIRYRFLGLWIEFATGARVGEVAALTRARFDRERRLLNMRDKRPVDRWVPISEALAEALEAHAASHERPELLGVARETVRIYLNRELKRACAAAKVEPFTNHALRRLAVESLYAEMDPKSSGAMLGHSDQVAMKHYARASQARARKAVLSTGLGDLEGGKVYRFQGGGEDG